MKGDVGSEATYRSNWVIVSSDLDRKLFKYQRPISLIDTLLALFFHKFPSASHR